MIAASNQHDWSTRQVAVPLTLGDITLPDPRATLTRLGGTTMGTTWSASVARAPGRSETRLLDTIESAFDRVVRQMSTWDETSALCRFNRSGGTWQDIPDETLEVLTCAVQVARASEGAFDPTVGALVDLWGFGPAGTRSAPPSPRDLERALRRCGWWRLEIDAASGRARHGDGASVDLSSIAKGFAADLAGAALQAEGVNHYLLEVGGELRGRGVQPNGQPWWVQIEPPGDPRDLLDPSPRFDIVLALCGCSVATSGDYRRGFSHDGRWYSHTIDPRTGHPVTHRLASVTVVADTCMLADAWSTALMVLGPDDGMALATRCDLAALLVERAEYGLHPIATPAFSRLLRD